MATPSLRQAVDRFLDDKVLSEELAQLQQELRTDPDYLRFAEIEDTKEQINTQARQEGDVAKAELLHDEANTMRKELQSYERYQEYLEKKQRADNLERLDKRVLTPDSEEAQVLLGALYKETENDKADTIAPFIDYKKNTSAVWNYVPDDAIRSYLDARFFMSTDRMGLHGNNAYVRSDGDPFTLPASIFVSAAAFESWKGRGDGITKTWSSKYTYLKTSSLNVMKHYAALSTDLPPVGEVNIYIQPDGRIFADNGSGDSHRIGAAFLRGDTAIKAEAVTFIKLEENVIDSDRG